MILHRLPDWWPGVAAFTVYQHVWVKDKYRGNVILLEHEAIHTRQQLAHPVWFWVSYFLFFPLFWNPFRRDWEAEAYVVQARIGQLDWAADTLSSWRYGWCCTKKKAKERIQKYMAEAT